jgi:hypothetical protein
MIIPVIREDLFEEFCKEFLTAVDYGEYGQSGVVVNSMKSVWIGHNFLSKHHIDHDYIPSERKIEDYIFNNVLTMKIGVFKVGEALGVEPYQLFVHGLTYMSDLCIIGNCLTDSSKKTERYRQLAFLYQDKEPHSISYWMVPDGSMKEMEEKFVKEFLAKRIYCSGDKIEVFMENFLKKGTSLHKFPEKTLGFLVDAMSRAESFGYLSQSIVDRYDYFYTSKFGAR